jgi:hypothetical protein
MFPQQAFRLIGWLEPENGPPKWIGFNLGRAN